MAWKEKNAIRRIYNVFKRSKDKIYTEDIEALKLINDKIENDTRLSVNDNLLYAKLLCLIIRSDVMHYGNIKMAIKKANDNLSMPLSTHIELLKINLNQNDLNQYLKSINFDYENLNETKLSELEEKEKGIIEKLKKNWSYDNVEKSFYTTANEFLLNIENYK